MIFFQSKLNRQHEGNGGQKRGKGGGTKRGVKAGDNKERENKMPYGARGVECVGIAGKNK